MQSAMLIADVTPDWMVGWRKLLWRVCNRTTSSVSSCIPQCILVYPAVYPQAVYPRVKGKQAADVQVSPVRLLEQSQMCIIEVFAKHEKVKKEIYLLSLAWAIWFMFILWQIYDYMEGNCWTDQTTWIASILISRWCEVWICFLTFYFKCVQWPCQVPCSALW